MATADTPWILTLPCDGPFPPPDLVARLRAAILREGGEIAAAFDGERLQPVHALIPVALAGSLQRFLEGGEREIGRWYARHRLALADFSGRAEGFANVNSDRDRERLERLLSR
jgi:molybdopterin-guanine dinucleotide biosynthesis protein A